MSFFKKLLGRSDERPTELDTDAGVADTAATTTADREKVMLPHTGIDARDNTSGYKGDSGMGFTGSGSNVKRTEMMEREREFGRDRDDRDVAAMKGTTNMEDTMMLREERLVVGKNAQEVGSVNVEKRIETSTAEVPVTLDREVVTVERRPVSDTSAAATSASMASFGKPESITTTATAEQAVASKVIVPTEQLQLTKRRIAETKTVEGKVRVESADVQRNLSDIEAIRPLAPDVASAGHATHSDNILGPDGKVLAFEERLAVNKERVPAGEVQVTKRVDNRVDSAPITLEREVVDVQRAKLSGAAGVPVPATLSEGSMRIGLKAETAVLGKRVVPKEEVVVRKEVETKEHMVTGEVGRERIITDAHGSIETMTAGATTSASNAAVTSGPYGSTTSTSGPYSSAIPPSGSYASASDSASPSLATTSFNRSASGSRTRGATTAPR